MRVVIAGGTGFLGTLLAEALGRDGHDLCILTRRVPAHVPPGKARLTAWTPDGTTGPWAEEVNGADAVVNLAGESIAGRRWSAQQKERILNSRVLATRSVVTAIQQAAKPPATLVNGSAVGYYGPRGDEPITEAEPPGHDFLGSVAAAWEREAGRASSHARVVCIRTGIVLHRRGGALPKMMPPFWFFAGGPVGSGRQYWPWVHWQDWVDLVRFAIRETSAAGPLNASAPNPVTNRDFARALGRAMHRPAFLPTPGFALKLLLGEMADALLLSGQRVVPARAQQLGFKFSYADVGPALEQVFRGR